MKNCFDCKIKDECECGKMIIGIGNYLSHGLYEQIEDIIKMEFDCEFYEK